MSVTSKHRMVLGARTFLLCRITIACLAFAMASTAGAAQPTTGLSDPEYTALVTQYRRGDVQGAMASLVKWPAKRVTAATRIRGPVPDLDIVQAEAAVMLHSDVAMLLAPADPRLSRQHMDAARAWVQLLPNDAARFKERWQAYAVGPFLVQRDLRSAALAVRQAIGAFPRSADLQLMRGTLLEMAALAETSDVRGFGTLSRQMETVLVD